VLSSAPDTSQLESGEKAIWVTRPWCRPKVRRGRCLRIPQTNVGIIGAGGNGFAVWGETHLVGRFRVPRQIQDELAALDVVNLRIPVFSAGKCQTAAIRGESDFQTFAAGGSPAEGMGFCITGKS
jgi:hypothetical protein